MLKKIYNHFMTDPFYQNSIFAMISTFVMAVSGFIFWLFVARLFTIENVGIATALISLMALISNFTHMGLNVGLMRYLPKSKVRNDIITSSFILVGIVTIIVTSIVILGISLISPHLSFLKSNPVYIVSFMFFMLGASGNIIVESIFMAYRASKNILLKNILLSLLKVVLPVFLITFGAYGIFAAISIATLMSFLVSIYILKIKYGYNLSNLFNLKAIKEMAAFSGSNYIAGFLLLAPTLILPLFIVNFLYAKAAAYYYIDSMILNLLIIIPGAATNAFMTEGSYNNTQLKTHFIKAIKIIYMLLLPAVVVIFFFGNHILSFFGKNYELEAFQFLQIISISSIFMSVTYLGTAILRIRHQLYTLIFMSLLGSVLVLGFSFLFISKGLVGVGWGWFIGQGIIALSYIVLLGGELRYGIKLNPFVSLGLIKSKLPRFYITQ